MKPVCLISVRSVYGVERLYPENDAAKIFAKIAGSKCLSNVNLLDIERLGFVIEIAPAKVAGYNKEVICA